MSVGQVQMHHGSLPPPSWMLSTSDRHWTSSHQNMDNVQISKQEKERLEKEEAAVIKWQEQQEAKQAAYIAAAIARQQKTQAALEQVWYNSLAGLGSPT